MNTHMSNTIQYEMWPPASLAVPADSSYSGLQNTSGMQPAGQAQFRMEQRHMDNTTMPARPMHLSLSDQLIDPALRSPDISSMSVGTSTSAGPTSPADPHLSASTSSSGFNNVAFPSSSTPIMLGDAQMPPIGINKQTQSSGLKGKGSARDTETLIPSRKRKSAMADSATPPEEPAQGPSPAPGSSAEDVDQGSTGEPDGPVHTVRNGEDWYKCTHCNKEYTGDNGRSVCKRHMKEKHGISYPKQMRKTRWDNDANRPKTEHERKMRTLECKRKWARKNRADKRALREQGTDSAAKMDSPVSWNGLPGDTAAFDAKSHTSSRYSQKSIEMRHMMHMQASNPGFIPYERVPMHERHHSEPPSKNANKQAAKQVVEAAHMPILPARPLFPMDPNQIHLQSSHHLSHPHPPMPLPQMHHGHPRHFPPLLARSHSDLPHHSLQLQSGEMLDLPAMPQPLPHSTLQRRSSAPSNVLPLDPSYTSHAIQPHQYQQLQMHSAHPQDQLHLQHYDHSTFQLDPSPEIHTSTMSAMSEVSEPEAHTSHGRASEMPRLALQIPEEVREAVEGAQDLSPYGAPDDAQMAAEQLLEISASSPVALPPSPDIKARYEEHDSREESVEVHDSGFVDATTSPESKANKHDYDLARVLPAHGTPSMKDRSRSARALSLSLSPDQSPTQPAQTLHTDSSVLDSVPPLRFDFSLPPSSTATERMARHAFDFSLSSEPGEGGSEPQPEEESEPAKPAAREPLSPAGLLFRNSNSDFFTSHVYARPGASLLSSPPAKQITFSSPERSRTLGFSRNSPPSKGFAVDSRRAKAIFALDSEPDDLADRSNFRLP